MPSIELEDWEADDLIAAYTKAAVEAGGQVTVVSSDKDLMQLIRPGVLMQDPIKQKSIGPDEVREKFGCGPEKMIDLLALMGDSVDNVPGVPGIGPKTACQLLSEFGDLEGVLGRRPGHETIQAPRIADYPRRSGPPFAAIGDPARRRPVCPNRWRRWSRVSRSVRDLVRLAALHGVPLHGHPAGPGWPGRRG